MNSVNPAPALVGTSRIDSLHYVLFGAYHLEATRQGLECDGWIPIVGRQDALESIRTLRLLSDECMLRVYEGISHSARDGRRILSNVPSQNDSEIDSEEIRSKARLSAIEMQELDFLTRDLVRILDKFNSEQSANARLSPKRPRFFIDFPSELHGMNCKSPL